VKGRDLGEQVSFQVSSESVNREHCLNGEWQTVPDERRGSAASEHCVFYRLGH